MTAPIAIYCWDQYGAEGPRLEDLTYEDLCGLLLRPVAWVGGSPVVTARAFADWIAAQRANDLNGNWGSVHVVALADGLSMLHVSGDALRRINVLDIHSGMTRAQVLALDPEIDLWEVGEGGTYRLADDDDWTDFTPLAFPLEK